MCVCFYLLSAAAACLFLWALLRAFGCRGALRESGKGCSPSRSNPRGLRVVCRRRRDGKGVGSMTGELWIAIIYKGRGEWRKEEVDLCLIIYVHVFNVQIMREENREYLEYGTLPKNIWIGKKCKSISFLDRNIIQSYILVRINHYLEKWMVIFRYDISIMFVLYIVFDIYCMAYASKSLISGVTSHAPWDEVSSGELWSIMVWVGVIRSYV